MADQPQYTGATYNAEMYKLPTETMSEYLARLAKLRAQGILGGGGMLDLKETPAADTALTQEEITSAPLGQLVRSPDYTNERGTSTTAPEPKTLEQMTADAIARQTQMNGPRAVEGLGLLSGPLGYVAKEIEDWSDTEVLGSYLDNAGFTDKYGKEARDAMAENPTAMLSLMSTGDLPAVGGFDRYNMANYSPQTWGDLGGRVINSVTDSINNLGGIIGGLFGSATPSATTTAAPQYMGFDFTPDPDQGLRTMEDVYGLTTVGNTGTGNYNVNAGGYVVGTAANRDPVTGAYTIGTSYNRDPVTGGYTIGTRSGSSPIAATEDNRGEGSNESGNGSSGGSALGAGGGNADRGFSFGGW